MVSNGYPVPTDSMVDFWSRFGRLLVINAINEKKCKSGEMHDIYPLPCNLFRTINDRQKVDLIREIVKLEISGLSKEQIKTFVKVASADRKPKRKYKCASNTV